MHDRGDWSPTRPLVAVTQSRRIVGNDLTFGLEDCDRQQGHLAWCGGFKTRKKCQQDMRSVSLAKQSPVAHTVQRARQLERANSPSFPVRSGREKTNL